MNTHFKALTNLSHSVVRSFSRLINRLTRNAKLSLTLTIALPPFLKMEAHYEKDFEKPAAGPA